MLAGMACLFDSAACLSGFGRPAGLACAGYSGDKFLYPDIVRAYPLEGLDIAVEHVVQAVVAADPLHGQHVAGIAHNAYGRSVSVGILADRTRVDVSEVSAYRTIPNCVPHFGQAVDEQIDR